MAPRRRTPGARKEQDGEEDEQQQQPPQQQPPPPPPVSPPAFEEYFTRVVAEMQEQQRKLTQNIEEMQNTFRRQSMEYTSPTRNMKMPNYDMRISFHGSTDIEQLQAWIAAARTYAEWYEANTTEQQRVALLLSILKDGAQIWASSLLTAEPAAFGTVEELVTVNKKHFYKQVVNKII